MWLNNCSGGSNWPRAILCIWSIAFYFCHCTAETRLQGWAAFQYPAKYSFLFETLDSGVCNRKEKYYFLQSVDTELMCISLNCCRLLDMALKDWDWPFDDDDDDDDVFDFWRSYFNLNGVNYLKSIGFEVLQCIFSEAWFGVCSINWKKVSFVLSPSMQSEFVAFFIYK